VHFLRFPRFVVSGRAGPLGFVRILMVSTQGIYNHTLYDVDRVKQIVSELVGFYVLKHANAPCIANVSASCEGWLINVERAGITLHHRTRRLSWRFGGFDRRQSSLGFHIGQCREKVCIE
jgi:hypothetical protein